MPRHLALVVTFLFFGCGQSPLLHHVRAGALNLAQADQSLDACPLQFKAVRMCASLTWTRPATESDPGEFTLRFWNSAEGTVNGPYRSPNGTVFVKLWMPSMGHGSSPVKVAPAEDSSHVAIPGVFQATDVYFVMPGKWEIQVQLKSGSQILDQAKLDVQI